MVAVKERITSSLTPRQIRDRYITMGIPRVPLALLPTPLQDAPRLAAELGIGRLLIKRDDAIAFAFGGNKVRKLAFVGARAQADGADTLITAGGVQWPCPASNRNTVPSG